MRSFTRKMAITVALCAAITGVNAADTYDQYVLTLKGASLDGTKDAIVFMSTRSCQVVRIEAKTSKGKGRVFGANSPGYLHIPSEYRMIGSGFVADGASLKGSFTMPAWAGSAVWEDEYSLDVKISGTALTGTYSAKLATASYPGSPEQYDVFSRPGNLSTKEVTGTVTGSYTSESTMKGKNGIASGKSWPCYQGPYGNFTATISSPALQLIDNPSQAYRVWMSEEIIPTPASTLDGYAMRYTPLQNGGAAGPVVADGLVYLYYYCGVGPLGKCTSRDGPPPPLQFNDAHDIVVCVDAATGKTVWKQVFANKGLTALPHKYEIANNTPVVADGRVYAMGSTALLYCMDAKTGTQIWEKPHSQHSYLAKLKASRLAGTTCSAVSGRQGGHALSYAGGVLIACPLGSSTSMEAFDGATGQALWTMKNAVNIECTPVRWVNGGKEYVVSAGRDTLFCLEPRTGKALWKQPHRGMNKQCIVNENYAIVRDSTSHTCYRITAASASRAWSAALGAGNGNSTVPGVIMGDYAYIRSDGISVFEIATGKKVAGISELTSDQECNTWASDGRVYVSKDEQHGQLKPFLVDANPKNFRILGSQWFPDLPAATGYEIPYINPIVDGRMFIRTADGIECWDLRKNGTVGIAPQTNPGKSVMRQSCGGNSDAVRIYDLRGRPQKSTGSRRGAALDVTHAGSNGKIVAVRVTGQ